MRFVDDMDSTGKLENGNGSSLPVSVPGTYLDFFQQAGICRHQGTPQCRPVLTKAGKHLHHGPEPMLNSLLHATQKNGILRKQAQTPCGRAQAMKEALIALLWGFSDKLVL